MDTTTSTNRACLLALPASITRSLDANVAISASVAVCSAIVAGRRSNAAET